MRRPVGVKRVLLVFHWTRFFSRRVATVASLPSALFMERFSLGASWVFSFQPVLPPDYRPPVPFLEWKLGQAINAVTGTRRLGFYLSFLRDVLPLCCCQHGSLIAVHETTLVRGFDSHLLPPN